MNAPMVRAILAGTKTQTRRVMGTQPVKDGPFWKVYGAGWSEGIRTVPAVRGHSLATNCPFGVMGDRLWVRETWGVHDQGFDTAEESSFIVYRADADRPEPKRWWPSIHMPREHCRLVLEITEVRVERLQEISEGNAIAEGIEGFEARTAGGDDGQDYWRDYLQPDAGSDGWPWFESPIPSFRSLWESINGAGSWEANPWVWAVAFKVVTP